MSQSTVAGNYGDPIVVDMGDGITLTLILSDGEATEAAAKAFTARLLNRQAVACGCPGCSGYASSDESDVERMIHRYTDMLDDLNDITACLLRESSMHGHTALQRSCINILNIACSAREWLNAEERRMRERGEAER